MLKIWYLCSLGAAYFQPIAATRVRRVPFDELSNGSTRLEEECETIVQLQWRELTDDQRLRGVSVLAHQGVIAKATTSPVGPFVSVHSLVGCIVYQTIAGLTTRIVAELTAYFTYFGNARRRILGEALGVPNAISLLNDLAILRHCVLLPSPIIQLFLLQRMLDAKAISFIFAIGTIGLFVTHKVARNAILWGTVVEQKNYSQRICWALMMTNTYELHWKWSAVQLQSTELSSLLSQQLRLPSHILDGSVALQERSYYT